MKLYDISLQLVVIASTLTYNAGTALSAVKEVADDLSSTSNATAENSLPTAIPPCVPYEKELKNQGINGTCSYVNGTIYVYTANGYLLFNVTPSTPEPSASGDESDSDDNPALGFFIDFINLLVDATPICLGLAIAFTTLIIKVFHLPHLLSCYRKHMKRLYRGEAFFLPKAKASTVRLMTLSWKYSGFQIAYILWGWIILAFIFFITFFVIAVCLHYNFISFKNIFLKFLPSIIFTIILIILQFLLAKFVLLTDRGAILGLENRQDPIIIKCISNVHLCWYMYNRRLFHLFGYYFFFYNTLVGIFSCLKRLFTALALGTLMIDRLDRSTLPRGWEYFDNGYKSYVGFLRMEHEFSNPYLVTFLYLLREATRGKQRGSDGKQVELQSCHVNSAHFISYRSRLARNRWLVAYTLINNPKLLADRSVDKLEHAALITRSLSKSTTVTGGSDNASLNEVLIKSEYTEMPS
jgi:hypothetical protein